MNILGVNISWQRKSTDIGIDTLIRRLEAVYETASGVQVTPDNCEQSPTVKAMVTAVTRRFALTPVHVLRKTVVNGRTVKVPQPDHWLEALLAGPNDWQSSTSYWMDAVSWLMRHGNYYAFKSGGVSGPIRRLYPLHPGSTRPVQDDDLNVTYKVTLKSGRFEEYRPAVIHHARLSARDGVEGNSPVTDIREAIALEIAAEKMGAAMFGNGAQPGLIFEYQEGNQGHKTDEDRAEFTASIDQAFAKKGRFRSLLLPKGIKAPQTLDIANDKAQFLELRQYQRTVIAGAWGCPPHLVGDLSKGTYNNVEQQDLNFTSNVIAPLARIFETAMERDLLTPEERRGGLIVRFNLDAMLRADFRARQEGLQIQRMNGIISPDEWREHEGMNPRPDGGGRTYYEQGPSGQQPSGSSGETPEDEDDEQ